MTMQQKNEVVQSLFRFMKNAHGEAPFMIVVWLPDCNRLFCCCTEELSEHGPELVVDRECRLTLFALTLTGVVQCLLAWRCVAICCLVLLRFTSMWSDLMNFALCVFVVFVQVNGELGLEWSHVGTYIRTYVQTYINTRLHLYA